MRHGLVVYSSSGGRRGHRDTWSATVFSQTNPAEITKALLFFTTHTHAAALRASMRGREQQQRSG